MTRPQFIATITDPAGVIFDVTDRIAQIGTLSNSLEEDVLELTHGDIDLGLRDGDGEVTEFFKNATPADEYTVEVWRESLRRRPKWIKAFGGILELPWSLTFDRKANTVTVQAFSFSKLLERASAEAVRRDVTGRTGSVTGGTNTVTPSSMTDFLVGDEVTMMDATNTETQVIASLGGSTFTTVDNWTNTFASDPLTLDTPYHRDKSLIELAGLLFDEATVEDYEINTQQVTSGDPFASRVASDHADEWTQINLNPHLFTLEERNPVGEDYELWLVDDGVDVQVVDSFTDTLGLGYDGFGLEYDAQEDEVWFSLIREEDSYEKLAHVAAGGGSVQVVKQGVGSTAWGTLRRLFEDTPTMGFHALVSANLERRDLATHGLIQTLTVETSHKMGATVVLDGGKFASGPYTEGGNWWVRLWTLPGWTVVENVKVEEGASGTATGNTYDTGTEQAVFGLAGQNYYTVSKSFGGIIPYADFDGQSVAAALRELALLSVSYVTVDEFKTGLLRGRTNFVSSRFAEPLDIGVPLTRESIKLTELYKASAKVTGEDDSGNAISQIAGDSGDSARRLTVGSQLITSTVLARAVAAAYFESLSQDRAEENVEIQEVGELVRPLSQVTMDGRTYDVLEVTSELENRTQDLRLVEAMQ